MSDKTERKLSGKHFILPVYIHVDGYLGFLVGLSKKEIAEKLFDGKEKAADEFMKWADTNKDGKVDFYGERPDKDS
ncbi:hypothetical protein EYZ11_012676 [Aspergillus tanneri]|uniref:EF-hand domain-containing protein n=1 Tax=Aspergillus tanneri TaxID=1220188 RepID=A0A4S3IZM6_9EURO|nr:hypothetical protein EYZ11_012676 [Aspergillus tanneri]